MDWHKKKYEDTAQVEEDEEFVRQLGHAAKRAEGDEGDEEAEGDVDALNEPTPSPAKSPKQAATKRSSPATEEQPSPKRTKLDPSAKKKKKVKKVKA